MLILLSPAKKLDQAPVPSGVTTTRPELIDHTNTLVAQLKTYSALDIAELMGLSQKLAELNYDRYQQFSDKFTADNASPAIVSFKGDVYQNIDTDNWAADDFAYAQKHVRILSGLYGILRPLDMMQAHRLEMGTSLPTERGKNLVEFWGLHITNAINRELTAQGNDIILNLASKEYISAVDHKALEGRMVTIQFKEYKDGKYKTIGLLAKRARGMMTEFIIRNRVRHVDDICAFDTADYAFNPDLSEKNILTFTR